MAFLKGHTLNKGNTYRVGCIPWNKGKKGLKIGPLGQHWKNSEKFKKDLSKRMEGNKYTLGRKHTKEQTRKIIEANSGEKCYRWIKDRTKVVSRHKDVLGLPKYLEWRKNTFTRDNWKCKINNKDCKGQLEAHHILPWRDYIELRYEVNNGITLCHFHHPRKRNDEMKLSPYFKDLIKM